MKSSEKAQQDLKIAIAAQISASKTSDEAEQVARSARIALQLCDEAVSKCSKELFAAIRDEVEE